MKRLLRAVVVPGGLGLALAAAAAFWHRGDWTGAALTLYPAFWLGAPCLLALPVLWMVTRDGSFPRAPIFFWRCLRVAAFTAGLALSPWLGRPLARHDVQAAQDLAESLIPRLESVRQATGRYPATLVALGVADGDRPRLARSPGFYVLEGATYRFVVKDPRSPVARYAYDSAARHWMFVRD